MTDSISNLLGEESEKDKALEALADINNAPPTKEEVFPITQEPIQAPVAPPEPVQPLAPAFPTSEAGADTLAAPVNSAGQAYDTQPALPPPLFGYEPPKIQDAWQDRVAEQLRELRDIQQALSEGTLGLNRPSQSPARQNLGSNLAQEFGFDDSSGFPITDRGWLGNAVYVLGTPFRAINGLAADVQRGLVAGRGAVETLLTGDMSYGTKEVLRRFSQPNLMTDDANFLFKALPNFMASTGGAFISPMEGPTMSPTGTNIDNLRGEVFTNPWTNSFMGINPFYAFEWLANENRFIPDIRTGQAPDVIPGADLEAYVQRGEEGYTWLNNLPRALGGGGGQARVGPQGLNRPALEPIISFFDSAKTAAANIALEVLTPTDVLFEAISTPVRLAESTLDTLTEAAPQAAIESATTLTQPSSGVTSALPSPDTASALPSPGATLALPSPGAAATEMSASQLRVDKATNIRLLPAPELEEIYRAVNEDSASSFVDVPYSAFQGPSIILPGQPLQRNVELVLPGQPIQRNVDLILPGQPIQRNADLILPNQPTQRNVELILPSRVANELSSSSLDNLTNINRAVGVSSDVRTVVDDVMRKLGNDVVGTPITKNIVDDLVNGVARASVDSIDEFGNVQTLPITNVYYVVDDTAPALESVVIDAIAPSTPPTGQVLITPTLKPVLKPKAPLAKAAEEVTKTEQVLEKALEIRKALDEGTYVNEELSNARKLATGLGVPDVDKIEPEALIESISNRLIEELDSLPNLRVLDLKARLKAIGATNYTKLNKLGLQKRYRKELDNYLSTYSGAAPETLFTGDGVVARADKADAVLDAKASGNTAVKEIKPKSTPKSKGVQTWDMEDLDFEDIYEEPVHPLDNPVATAAARAKVESKALQNTSTASTKRLNDEVIAANANKLKKQLSTVNSATRKQETQRADTAWQAAKLPTDREAQIAREIAQSIDDSVTSTVAQVQTLIQSVTEYMQTELSERIYDAIDLKASVAGGGPGSLTKTKQAIAELNESVRLVTDASVKVITNLKAIRTQFNEGLLKSGMPEVGEASSLTLDKSIDAGLDDITEAAADMILQAKSAYELVYREGADALPNAQRIINDVRDLLVTGKHTGKPEEYAVYEILRAVNNKLNSYVSAINYVEADDVSLLRLAYGDKMLSNIIDISAVTSKNAQDILERAFLGVPVGKMNIAARGGKLRITGSSAQNNQLAGLAIRLGTYADKYDETIAGLAKAQLAIKNANPDDSASLLGFAEKLNDTQRRLVGKAVNDILNNLGIDFVFNVSKVSEVNAVAEELVQQLSRLDTGTTFTQEVVRAATDAIKKFSRETKRRIKEPTPTVTTTTAKAAPKVKKAVKEVTKQAEVLEVIAKPPAPTLSIQDAIADLTKRRDEAIEQGNFKKADALDRQLELKLAEKQSFAASKSVDKALDAVAPTAGFSTNIIDDSYANLDFEDLTKDCSL